MKAKARNLLAELHVRDLFDGLYGAPQRLAAPTRDRKQKKRKKRKRPRQDTGSTRTLRAIPRPRYDEIPCPCCKRPIEAPTLNLLVDYYRIPALEAAVLEAVWRGKGHPIPTERIFDAMYADDPDGGPSPGKMYSAFKVTLCHLRARISGSGVTIENVGYRRGYRLSIGEK